MADWKKIKTEYITSNISYRALAEKYGVHYQTICRKSKAEKWVEQRKRTANKTVTKSIDKISNQQVDRAAKLASVADLLLDKIRVMVEENPEIMTVPQNMKHISGVLKDIKDIQMIKSAADIKEQEARIEKLRKDTHDPSTVPTIVIQGLPEEYKA